MATMDRPRQVVFNLLKQTWGITHQETLAILGTGFAAANYSGERKTALSREIVNVEPEKYLPGTFAPFAQSSAELVARMHHAQRGPVFNDGIAAYLAGEAAGALRGALDRYGLDGVLFSNTMADIAQDARLGDADRAHLLALLFCAAGCTGDVRAAVDEALAANRNMGARFVTTQAGGPAGDGEPAGAYDFALLRIDAGGQGGRHVLSTGPEGTEVGRQATSASAITDVDMSVSKRHARIWRDDDGRWWVEGLGSTNGTCLIDAVTRETIVVEPPQGGRLGGAAAGQPVELHLGDILVLADTTQFWVQAV